MIWMKTFNSNFLVINFKTIFRTKCNHKLQVYTRVTYAKLNFQSKNQNLITPFAEVFTLGFL